MNFINFFDPLNIEHLKAYKHLQEKGSWPPGFIPPEVQMEPQWYLMLQYKMANLWVQTNLFVSSMDLTKLNEVSGKLKKLLDKENQNARESDDQST